MFINDIRRRYKRTQRPWIVQLSSGPVTGSVSQNWVCSRAPPGALKQHRFVWTVVLWQDCCDVVGQVSEALLRRRSSYPGRMPQPDSGSTTASFASGLARALAEKRAPSAENNMMRVGQSIDRSIDQSVTQSIKMKVSPGKALLRFARWTSGRERPRASKDPRRIMYYYDAATTLSTFA
jgi:hypothetical protein